MPSPAVVAATAVIAATLAPVVAATLIAAALAAVVATLIAATRNRLALDGHDHLPGRARLLRRALLDVCLAPLADEPPRPLMVREERRKDQDNDRDDGKSSVASAVHLYAPCFD
jgi:hypothetical protein